MAKQVGAASSVGKECAIDSGKLSSMPDLKVVLGGQTFTLAPSDHALSVSGECLCLHRH